MVGFQQHHLALADLEAIDVHARCFHVRLERNGIWCGVPRDSLAPHRATAAASANSGYSWYCCQFRTWRSANPLKSVTLMVTKVNRLVAAMDAI